MQASGLRPATLLKKRLCHRRFSVNFAKFLRIPFPQNTSGGCLCFVIETSAEKCTAWKVSKYGVFSGPYFPVFRPEKSPYLDTFYAVMCFKIFFSLPINCRSCNSLSLISAYSMKTSQVKTMDLQLQLLIPYQFRNTHSLVFFKIADCIAVFLSTLRNF